MKFKNAKRLLSVLLSISLMLSFASAAYAANDGETPQAEDTLQTHMTYFVDYIGQRLAASPNEDKAAAYIKEQFEAIGYTDVMWGKPTRTAVNTGRVVFSDGSGDILGNALPNSADFGIVSGKLVDLGTYPDLSVPEGVTGKIIGAVRFNGAPNANDLNPLLEALALAKDIEFTGVLLANAATYTVAKVTGTPNVPSITTTGYFLNRALAKAEHFDHMEWYTNTLTNAVVATKPATGNDPDMIIVVSSHMDSVLASPGASDNASAAAATLELARRFFDADLGNIEVRFAICGSEESGGMAGSVYVANQLAAEGKAPISINLNMDMVCSPSKTGNGRALNAVSMDISPNPLAFNLPAYLVTDNAKETNWAPGIENVRIYRYGSSDHVSFTNRGIEAASMIVVTDDTDDIEAENHNSRDNLQENYSYERHLMCTNLIGNAIRKAAEQQVSKRAKFYVNEEKGTVTLVNAAQLFKTYNEVNGNFEGAEEQIPFAFTPDNTVVALENPQDYTIANVSAQGIGTADNMNAQRNEQYKHFKAGLAVQKVDEIPLLLTTDAFLVKAGDTVAFNTAFAGVENSNTAALTYTFDKDKFEYVDYTAADGVTVVDTQHGEGFVKVTVMIPGYNAQNLGALILRAKPDVALNDSIENVILDAAYVIKDINGEKDIKTDRISVSFVTINNDRVLGDTNGDGIVDLIDLSNMIDWFGVNSSNSEWKTRYVYFDFNNNGQIDIYDLSFVAQLIK